MSIECYEKKCKHHGIHYGDDGPFCDEHVCNFQPLTFVDKLRICFRRWWRTPRKDRHSLTTCDWSK